MAIQIQLRQGTTTEHNTFKGAVGEVTVDTTKKTLVVHDGVTAGGTVLAKVSEVPSLVPQTTEAVAGKAKIATTTIAQAGVNDTDIITAKKLRDALNASGSAPISACRARVVFDANANILNSDNILSVTKNGAGDFTVKFINAMPDANYAVVATALGSARCVALHETSSNPTLKTTTVFRILCFATGTGNATDTNQINLGVFR